MWIQNPEPSKIQKEKKKLRLKMQKSKSQPMILLCLPRSSTSGNNRLQTQPPTSSKLIPWIRSAGSNCFQLEIFTWVLFQLCKAVCVCVCVCGFRVCVCLCVCVVFVWEGRWRILRQFIGLGVSGVWGVFLNFCFDKRLQVFPFGT